MKTIYIILLMPLLLASQCPSQGPDSVANNVTSAMEGRQGQGLTAGCSMSDEPGLQRALTLNSALTNAVSDSAQACQNSVRTLNNDSINRSMQQLYESREQIEDVSVTIANYRSEIERLSANNPDGIYNNLIAELERNIASAERRVRDYNYGSDAEQRAQRRRAIESLPSIVAAYDNVLANCSGENHQAVASMAQSGLAFASSLAGNAGSSVHVASMLMRVATSLQNFIPTMEDRIQDNLQSARIPYILTCGIEALTASYCEVDRHLTNIRFRQRENPSCYACVITNEVSLPLESFVWVTQMLPQIEGLYQSPCNPRDQDCIRRSQTSPVPGGGTNPDTEIGIDRNTAIYSARADSLYNRLDQIDNYLNNIISETEEPLERASDRLASQRRNLRTASSQAREVILEVRELLHSENALAQSAELFTNPRYNLFHQVQSISELHRQVMRRELLEGADGRDLVDMEQRNLFILSDESALQAATSAMAQSAHMGMPAAQQPSGQNSFNGLSHAHRVASSNISGFSDFVDGRVDLANVINGIRSEASSPVSGSNQSVASTAVADQLCGASLALYKNSTIPEDLVSACTNSPQLGGKSYEELAQLPWDQRVCLPINLGIIGR
jgi:hypothetical protein